MKDVSASRQTLTYLFNRMEFFFRRLEVYTVVPLTAGMTDIIVEIMLEVLTVLAVVTKEMKRGRMSESVLRESPISNLNFYLEKYLKKLMGNTEIEDTLQRLDRLTQEEAMMASTELIKITHSVEGRVTCVDGRVQDVRSDVQNVGKRVEDKVEGVSDKVLDIDGKLEQVNRSSSPRQTIRRFVASNIFIGTQLRDNLLRWLSPSDPSVNHNIASKAHHNGTSQWFFHGGMFKEWRATGSFLWVHGKRAFLQALAFIPRYQS